MQGIMVSFCRQLLQLPAETVLITLSYLTEILCNSWDLAVQRPTSNPYFRSGIGEREIQIEIITRRL